MDEAESLEAESLEAESRFYRVLYVLMSRFSVSLQDVYSSGCFYTQTLIPTGVLRIDSESTTNQDKELTEDG